MIKVLTLKLFKDLKAGVIRQPDFVFEATPERFEELKNNLGDGFVVEVRIVKEDEIIVMKENGVVESVKIGDIGDATILNISDNEVTEIDLKHIGGGYYELSNGEKIKGKDAAIEAEKAL